MNRFEFAAILIPLALITAGCGSSAETEPVSTASAGTNSASTTGTTNTSSTLTVTASSTEVDAGSTSQLTASGGTSPYYYFVETTGNWSIDSTSGLFTAYSSATSGTVQVLVTDTVGDSTSITLTISGDGSSGNNSSSNPLSVTASSSSINSSGTDVFTVSGGTPPYVYSLVSGAGSLSVSGSSTSNTTVYTASSSESDIAEVEVVDSAGNVSTAQVTVTSQVANTTQFSTSFNLYTDDMLGVTLSNPSTSTYPSLVFFGTGSKPDEPSMLAHTAYQTCGSDFYGNSVSPCTIEVGLTNFEDSNPGTTTYEGTVTYVGRSGSGSYTYCIDPNTSLSQAYILPGMMSGSATNYQFLTIAYNDSTPGRKLLNGVETTDFLSEVDTNSGAGWVYVYVSGAYTSNTSCSSYGSNYVEAYNN